MIILSVIYIVIILAISGYGYSLITSKELLVKSYGDMGENAIAYCLGKLNDNYEIEHDVRVGRYQIDHLAVDKLNKIVYVIETKNWHGNITGKISDKYWYNVNYKYLNPVIQNKKHCSLICDKYLDGGYKMESLVVFANDNVRWECRSRKVIRYNKLLDTIKGA